MNPSQHFDIPGHPPSGYDDIVLAQLGDVRQTRGRYTNLAAVVVSADIFRLMNTWWAPQVANVDAKIANGDLKAGLGVYAVGDPDTTEIRARYAVPLGPSLAALALPGPLSPREFWERVGAHICTDPDHLAACDLVLWWDRLASLAPAAGVALCPNQWNPPLALVDLRDDILEGRLELVMRDLPGLRPGSDDPMTMVATSMGALVVQQRQAQALAVQQRQEDRADKTLSDVWRGDFDAVLHLTEAASEANLPPIYALMARAKKSSRGPA